MLCFYPLVSQFREGVHNNTKDDVQTDGGDNYEETQVKQ